MKICNLKLGISRIIVFILAFLSLVFIIYGALAIKFNIFFFWESSYLGWILIWLSLFLLLKILYTKLKNRKLKILALVFLISTLIVFISRIGFWILLLNTEALNVAKMEAQKKHYVLFKEKVSFNEIKGIPSGSFNVSQDRNGTSGVALVKVLVKGRKYSFYIINLSKKKKEKWKLIGAPMEVPHLS